MAGGSRGTTSRTTRSCWRHLTPRGVEGFEHVLQFHRKTFHEPRPIEIRGTSNGRTLRSAIAMMATAAGPRERLRQTDAAPGFVTRSPVSPSFLSFLNPLAF